MPFKILLHILLYLSVIPALAGPDSEFEEMIITDEWTELKYEAAEVDTLVFNLGISMGLRLNLEKKASP